MEFKSRCLLQKRGTFVRISAIFYLWPPKTTSNSYADAPTYISMICNDLNVGLVVSVVFGAVTGAAQARQTVLPLYNQVGWASWYGQREAGRRTASGSVFDSALLTAAHRKLPLGSCIRVTHLRNGRSVIVPVTDRGPYRAGRLLDLSQAAARMLGMEHAGLARVRITAAACVQNSRTGIDFSPQAPSNTPEGETVDSTGTPSRRIHSRRI